MSRPRQLGAKFKSVSAPQRPYSERGDSVKGEADFEKSTLTQVINARAKATSIQATPELMENPEAFQKFTQAQAN